jgi:hypothetical protein
MNRASLKGMSPSPDEAVQGLGRLTRVVTLHYRQLFAGGEHLTRLKILSTGLSIFTVSWRNVHKGRPRLRGVALGAGRHL